MTNAQQNLVNVAREAQKFLEAKAQGRQMRGLYDDISLGRLLDAAIHAVEKEAGVDGRDAFTAEFGMSAK